MKKRIYARLLAVVMCCLLLCLPVQAEGSRKMVALTFDDGPSGRFTRRLLEGLEQRDVRATFFLCGYRIEQYPDLTEQIFRENHEIGLHGYTHNSMRNMCRKEVDQEIDGTMALIPEGCAVAFLRPPGGLCGEYVQAAAAAQGLAVLEWSLDPKDWAIDDADTIKKDVLRRVRDGDVILLHDMSDSSVDAALAIVDALLEQGFRFVTASELARLRGCNPAPGKVYSRFPSNPRQELK